MILLVRISEGSDNGDTDNRGCTVLVLVLKYLHINKLYLYLLLTH